MISNHRRTGQRPLKVLFSAVAAKSGGAATYLFNLVREVINTEHRYIFYVPEGLANLHKPIAENVKVVATHIGYKSSLSRFLWDQFALRQIAKNEKIDVLVSSSDFGVLFPPCQQILMVRNPLFFSSAYLHNILPGKSKRFKVDFTLRRWLIARSIKSSDIIITASESMLDAIKTYVPIPDGKAIINCFGVPMENFDVVPQKFGKREIEKTQGSDNTQLRLLYVSEYNDYKNLTTLLKAILLLRQESVGGFFLVTTADPNQFPDVEIATREEDRALASHPAVRPFVKFTGRVSYEDIPRLYSDSELFVFPSLTESFGHPLVEAMASGLPIIASDIPICREICADAAVYFSPLDAKDLAEKIVLLRNNGDLRRRLGEIGRNRAELHFDWKDHVRRLVEIIDRLAVSGQS